MVLLSILIIIESVVLEIGRLVLIAVVIGFLIRKILRVLAFCADLRIARRLIWVALIGI